MPTLAPSPQLLSRAAAPPNGNGWLHEIKYDGFRLLTTVERGRASLWSRPGADWTARLPWIAKAITELPVRSAALDGELVYLRDDGRPDFEALQQATRSTNARERLYYQLFDLLCLNGEDLTSWPLIERKARLGELLTRANNARLRYVSHVDSDGDAFFRAVDELGLEGIVCKRATSIYQPGLRAASWVKVKCFRTQRFAIVGYTQDGQLATLALAGEHNGALHYAGQVEWGVPRRDDRLLRVLGSVAECTATITNASRSAHIEWIEPRLYAEVRALAWEPGRQLRHAVLQSVSPLP